MFNKYSVLNLEKTEPTIDQDIDSKKGDKEFETFENEAAECPTHIWILQRPERADHSKGKKEVRSAEQPIVSKIPKDNVRSAERSVKSKRNT